MTGIERRLAALEGRAAQTGERWGYDDADLAFLAEDDIRFLLDLAERRERGGATPTADELRRVAELDELRGARWELKDG